MNNLRAVLPVKATKSIENARAPSGNKEQTGQYTVVAASGKELHEPVTVRCWMGRSNQASVVYACIWIRTKDGRHFSGRGTAGGYGYHKASAAIDEAIRSAGVGLFGYPYSGPNRDRDGKPMEDILAMLKDRKPASISGVGEQAIESAIQSIARAAGYRGTLKVVS